MSTTRRTFLMGSFALLAAGAHQTREAHHTVGVLMSQSVNVDPSYPAFVETLQALVTNNIATFDSCCGPRTGSWIVCPRWPRSS